ncbi:MAG: MotA/TolQ/ExbB proton channel family protein [Gammaproteobacteria bacterium]|uniref:MotA/TolQ/ExbB proton channel family protein n=1 Tax=SAR86 cluster bacterium TaxID=2030880 RepID=A0A520MXG3_9GAMM|nr:biopolymer transporter ExbB [Gammaproteobacteria bacterium]MBA4730033.1 MotA/TolQ/ExbB proton channel family protein [SAR86 cluster bacterium]RZO25912.1 MAG: MotA/TolQ/ExbB proton channel family protein [SAR86 cluster bacterium]|tara:strand:+ start:18598 stop:19974 length:1377 start_codon:yes stop_codon:yes gene_type:complete
MNFISKYFLTLLLFVSFLSISQESEEAVPTNLDKLLELVKEGKDQEQAENDQREEEFKNSRNRQQEILSAEQRELARQERIADELEEIFRANQELLRVAEEAYLKQLGSLNELFGHMQSISTDSRVTFETSLTAAEFGKERESFLGDLTRKMGESTQLPTISEIERVWYEIMREMKATGEVVKFETNVINVDGTQVNCEVVRVGVYNAVCGNKYLEYVPAKGQYQFLARQPAGRYTGSAGRISRADASSGYVSFSIDPSGPSGGALLANLIQNPSLLERIDQGGIIGYIILAIGGIALAFAIYKYVILYLMNRDVNDQLGSDHAGDNPLGRVLSVGQTHMKDEIDRLELKLAEAIMAERPSIERGISFVKIVSVVAPLAGLLGTVTGMIITFQQITLFGTGDPKIMAGGISQALVTTVLGLVVAIPTTLAHSFLQSSARSVVDVLEEQATGIVAEKAK